MASPLSQCKCLAAPVTLNLPDLWWLITINNLLDITGESPQRLSPADDEPPVDPGAYPAHDEPSLAVNRYANEPPIILRRVSKRRAIG